MDQRQAQLSRKSVSYQVIKYILLILNIMIATTTASVTIIICLIPNIINEKREVIEDAINFYETGSLSRIDPETSIVTNHQQTGLSKLDIVSILRYIIIAISGLIILNQSLAVYGLFREKSCPILASTTFIGLIGQLSIYVLPSSIFITILLYIVLSISFVIMLNHIESQSKHPVRANSRAPSVDPQNRCNKVCCCRCKSCLCTSSMYQPQCNAAVTATINPSRKTSIQSQAYPNPPYYYGSLGRRIRDPRPMLSQLNKANELYTAPQSGQRIYNAMNTLKPANKFSNINIDSTNLYGIPRRGSINQYSYVPFERAKDSTIM